MIAIWAMWFWGKFQKYIIITGAAVAFVVTVWFTAGYRFTTTYRSIP